MQINISLDGTEGSRELNALAALIASLGGRASTPVTNVMHVEQPAAPKLREPGDDEGEPRNTDTSEKDAEIIDAAVAAGAPEYDSAGLPWDARIHATSRATLQDGTWRRRKNTDDALFESVMAELRAAHPMTEADVPAPPPPADTTNDTPESPAPELVVTAPAAVVAEPAADVPAPPASTDGPDLSSFAKFVGAVNAKDVPQENKVYEALNKLAKEVAGVDAFKDLLKKPESWALFYDMV